MIEKFGISGVLTFSSNKWDRRQNLNGIVLKDSSLNYKPFIMFEMLEQDVVNPRGFSYDLMQLLAKQLNFTHIVVRPLDGNWGFRKFNSSVFNGIIGMLQRYAIFSHFFLTLALMIITF